MIARTNDKKIALTQDRLVVVSRQLAEATPVTRLVSKATLSVINGVLCAVRVLQPV